MPGTTNAMTKKT